MRPSTTNTQHRHSGLRGARSWRIRTAIIAVLALASVGTLASPAYADDYPSWQDVQNAKSNEAAASAKVTQIEALISQLQGEVAQTEAEAQARGTELEIAQQKFADADRRAEDLQTQADASKTKADAATKQAARLAAQLYRTGGGNLSANLFLHGGTQDSAAADRLLSNLGSMSKLVESTNDIYKYALMAQNSEKSLSAQASVAKAERETLRNEADAALKAAVAAAQAAAAKLAAQQQQILVLQAQAAALRDKTASVVTSYEQGVAARAAAAAAAGSGAGLPGGYVGPQGWANPVRGVITDGFGSRVSPCPGCSSYHYGIDIGAPGGSPIYAAHDGTVQYAGWNGTCGYTVQINHGGGITTEYCHIMPGGIMVGIGQQVGAGQPIARVGMTGAATGYHLHFEVWINGRPINGIPFMAERGAPLG
ncbi:peptidoglycan DD-metalloendopeptidase family protein [Rathayibacter soli]|uniref:peptidoglycan DD-metalloendopeptidase family protein n=1 Tax=Rathayibacter soli TaxID=3144168 RepID=UPI0027E41119|nr:peptidoglycan DD-metalloendopeptidase family protein [Glaciibacter superstes]